MERLIFIFRKTEIYRWWHRFLHPDYHHVTALSLSDTDTHWVLNDAENGCLETLVLRPGELHELCRNMAACEAKLFYLEVTRHKSIDKRVIRFGLLTCVSHAMLLAGIYRWRVVTPYQFKRLLTRLGATNVTGNFLEEIPDG